ncbi:MAG: autotransporter assembly complex protein TamA [Gemmatimonadota bacterium]
MVCRLLFALLLTAAAAAAAVAAERPLARFAVAETAPTEVSALLDRVLQSSASEAGAVDREEEERLLRRLRAETIDVLSTEGYFAPKITIEPDAGGNARYLVKLELGPRTLVTEVQIDFTGAITNQPERERRLRSGWELPVGEPFRDSKWSNAKSQLLNRVRSRDYAAARLADSYAEVSVENATAKLHVTIDSGPVYTIGELQVKGLVRYDRNLVQRYSPFKVGDPYNANKLLDFQRALQSTPYFGTVVVDANPEQATDHRVPVVVELTEAKTRRLSLALGYSTDTGVGAEVAYRQTLLFGFPYTLQSGVGAYSRERSVAYADILLPPKPDGEQDSFGALYERTDIQGLLTYRWAVGAQRTYKRTSGRAMYDTTLALNFQRERTEVLSDQSANTANDVVAGTYSWTRRNVDSLTNPTRGDLLTLSGTLGLRRSGLTQLLSQNFERVYGRYVYYWPLSPRDQLILRAEGGHVFVDNVSIVPNEYLFRTGGVGTVRGYAYQSLGTKTGTATTGSKSLLVGSTEYVRWLTKEWGAAAFFDIGNADDDILHKGFARGYGVGARYRTLAGPIALDLAYGDRSRTLRLHFSIAIAF